MWELGADGYDGRARRTRPTFVDSPESPLIGDAWTKATFRQRVSAWYAAFSSGNPVAGAIYAATIVKSAVYLAFFYYLLRDADAPLFGELNAKRFLLYNLLGDVTGCNSTNGLLGLRFKSPFGTWWNLLTPGTLCSPLVPGLPGTRGLHLVALYVVYIGSMAWALMQPAIGFSQLWLPVLCLAAILPQDLVVFLASRGEHYGYFLVAALFPSHQFLFACQVVQCAVWFWAGMSKVGPWFKYVTSAMTINSLLLKPFPSLLKLLHKGPHDATPSALACGVTVLGTAMELSLAPLCVLLPAVGVPVVCLFHFYIFCMVPFASVMEWNVFCVLSAIYHFQLNTVSMPMTLSPLLAGFLVVVAGVVPLVGQLYPKLVPFLVAYRPYAGNWRFSWHIVDNKATHKLRKLKTLDSPFMTENAAGMMTDKVVASQFEHQVAAGNLQYPHFRPLVPLVEELQARHGWGEDDFTLLFQDSLYNVIYGWCLGTGFYTNSTHFAAMTKVCGFEKGECYVAVFEPMGLLDHTSEWKLFDVAVGAKPVMAGKLPYAELEKFHPTGVTREALGLAGKKGQ